MSTTFRLFKSCSTAATVSRNRAGTRLVTFVRPPHPGTDHTTLHVDRVPSSTLDLLSPLFRWSGGVCLTGVATQKSCKRRIHVASSTTTTQLPGPGAAFASSTGSTSSPTKLRSLYARTSRRTHSTPSNSTPNSRNNSQEGRSETFHSVTGGTPEELASHLNGAFGTLVFPLELATRLLTHPSHPASRVDGHNGRLAFTGE